eukprot:3994191-Alexandrium_andersonii.AAC.1
MTGRRGSDLVRGVSGELDARAGRLGALGTGCSMPAELLKSWMMLAAATAGSAIASAMVVGGSAGALGAE